MKNSKVVFGILAMFVFFLTGASAQVKSAFKPDKELLSAIPEIFTAASSQYLSLGARLAPEQFPKTYYAAKDSLETSSSGWWCTGFYPGTLLNLYKQTNDARLLQAANKSLGYLEKEQFTKTTHDLGFMMFCSFGNAQTIEPSQAYREILLNSAKSLSTRFNPKTGCIKSWDHKPGDYLVIIDNMMNLELLFWATRASHDSSYYKIAVTHAETTIKNHFRPDHSSYHVINYDPQTGQVKEKKTAQGFANESAWARGQAWGLYGYTVMYRETKDKKYLAQAEGIANFMLNHKNFPADKIPYWDFNAPNIPDEFRDASAAAIIASALLELCKYAAPADGQKYFTVAGQILKNLSKPAYTAAPGTNGGFILMHGVGHFPAKTEIDVPLTYADYYYIEALGRYKGFAGR